MLLIYKGKLVYLVFYILLLKKASQNIYTVDKEEIITNKLKYKVEKILDWDK